MKKFVSLMLAAVLCTSFASFKAVSAAMPEKLSPTKTNISVFTQISGATVEDIMTNEFTQWYEDNTNVHVDWRVVTTGASAQIPLIVASGDMPDVFLGFLSDVMLQTYSLVDKVFVPLTDYINEETTPNIMNMLNESEIARQYTYMPDGNIYSLLRIVDTYNERVTKRCWAYEPWLDALNMSLPTTTHEFYNMLCAFRDKIPGMLDIKGVVPFAGATSGNPANNEPESYILNSFIYYDNTTFLEVGEDGKLNFVANTEEYRDGLRYLSMLYREGLLAPDTWTQDRKGLLAMTEGGEHNVLGAATAMYWGHFTTEGGELGRDHEFTAVPVLEGPNGVRNAYDRGQLANNGRLVVTSSCKESKIPIIMKWADWFFDADGMMDAGYSVNYGPINSGGWTLAKPGELNAAGEQAKYRYLRFVDTKQNDNWFQVIPYYESADYIGSVVNDFYNRKEAYGGAQTAEKYMPYSALDKKVPFLYFPLEYTEELNRLKDSLQNTTTGEVNVHRDRFITGELSLDKDWDAYVALLDKVGVDRYVELYQKTYDSYLETQAKAGF